MEAKDLTLKQKMALKTIKWTQRIAVKKAKKGMSKLYQKHEQLLKVLMDDISQFILIEPEQLSMKMATIVCTNIIAGFDTQKEMQLVKEMIDTTIVEYNKENRTPLK